MAQKVVVRRSSPGAWSASFAALAAVAVLVVACGGGQLPPPPATGGGPEDSDGELVLVAPDPTRPHPLGTDVVFDVVGAGLSGAVDDVLYFLNGTPMIGATVLVDGARLTLVDPLQPGPNHVEVYARDDQGFVLAADARFWLGDETMFVSVIDRDGFPVAGAEVSVTMVDDPNVSVVASAPAGTATFLVSAGTVVVTATAPGGLFGVATYLGDIGLATVVVAPIGTPSAVDNNNFALGTAGWVLDADDDGFSPVTLVAHVPGPLGAAAAMVAPVAVRPDRRAASGVAGSVLQSIAPSSDGTNVDLALSTSGEGTQSVLRIFETGPQTRNVLVRFRFVTSEVPGGYFGSEFNDAYSVYVRSQVGGGLVVFESNSMNGLGLSAFDDAGATAWRELSLPVAPDGDVVEVDLSVTNVGDGDFDSQVIVDLVVESGIAIPQAALHDITGDPLTALSVGPHPYFSGQTRVHGTITVEGSEDDELSSLTLEVLEGGFVVATGELASSARSSLLTAFGPDERVRLTTPQLLFEIPAAGMAAVDTVDNGDVTLRIQAVAASGATATYELGAVPKLVRYQGRNRYGGRNESEGGDDWAKPNVKIAIDHFTETYPSDGLLFGDFSNMNGGRLAPHSTHRTGNDVDGFFTGYTARNAATANKMIAYLNDTAYGSQIAMVIVTFSRTAEDPFWTAIQNVTLDDGRRARDVIVPAASHDTHFHWKLFDD